MENCVRAFINAGLNLKLTNRKFPGSMPVSIGRAHLARINGTLPDIYTEYSASSKLDGDRYFMGILNVDSKPTLFLVNRKFEVLCKPTQDLVNSDYFAGSLFDVEVIGVDIVIFDCITCCGHSVKHLSYLHRVELVRAFLVDCYQSEVVAASPYEFKSNFKSSRVAITPTLILNAKPIFPMSHVKYVQSQWADDGLIFTEVRSPYQPYRCSETAVLKWKPADRITIDFEVLPRNRHFTLSTEWPDKFTQHTGQKSLRLGSTIVSHIDTESEGICESFWDESCQRWRVVQSRADKTKSNTFDTGLRTLESIEAAISLEEISFI